MRSAAVLAFAAMALLSLLTVPLTAAQGTPQRHPQAVCFMIFFAHEEPGALIQVSMNVHEMSDRGPRISLLRLHAMP